MDNAHPQRPVMAAGLILLASVFVAVSTLFAKGLGTGALGSWALGAPMHPLQISHGRFLFALATVLVVAGALRLRFRAPNWRIHIARSSIGWLGVTLMFAAVAFIPMADATAISFLNPVFCMLLAIPLLHERVGPWRWAAAAIALTGALVLLRPTAASFQPAALLALGAAMLFGLELILIKILSGRERPLQILLLNNTLGFLIASIAVALVWQAPTGAQWVALIGVGLSMIAAQACYVNAMARADASFVAPFSYATLVCAALLDAVIFATLPDLVSYCGIAVILTGALLLAWRESRIK